MTLMRKAGMPAILLLTLLWLGCGDVFRPVANPIPKPGGDPATFHYVVSVNNNPGVDGSTTHVDVSGDVVIGRFPVGRNPVHAALLLGQAAIFVANEASDSLSFYSPPSCSLSLPCSGTPTGTPANIITLPAGSGPVFVAAGPAGKIYVANAGTNSVGVISTTSFVQTASVPVGPQPSALVLSSDGSKLYCINKGNGTVTVIATADSTILGSLTVGRSPIAAALSPDGSLLYVLNQGSGTVSVINTVTDALVGSPAAVGSTPTQMFIDPRLTRLYVSNRGSNTVSVFDISSQAPAHLKDVRVGTAPVSVTVLGNGSRAYVANSGSNNVTVIDASSLTVKTTIDLHPDINGQPNPAPEPNPVFVATSSGETSRVYVANFGPPSVATCTTGVSADPAHPECYGFISDIDTATDTVVAAGTNTGIPVGATVAASSPRPVFLVPSR